MIRKLDKSKITQIQVEPNEGERTLLSSNISDQRSPFLGFLDTSSKHVTEDMVLDYLASIIADIYLDQMYGNTTNKESGSLLPGLDQGTS